MEQTFINRISDFISGRNIFLIGMMGCGKSKTGPILAETLSYKFIDLDSLIEKVSNKSIDAIFREDGESTFRDIETKCLKETVRVPSLVVSTGGGIVINSINWGALRQGIVIWIDLDKEIALKRLSDQIQSRPLLNNKDLNKSYSDILDSREELYSQADIRIKVSNETIDQVVEMIIYQLQDKLNLDS